MIKNHYYIIINLLSPSDKFLSLILYLFIASLTCIYAETIHFRQISVSIRKYIIDCCTIKCSLLNIEISREKICSTSSKNYSFEIYMVGINLTKIERLFAWAVVIALCELLCWCQSLWFKIKTK